MCKSCDYANGPDNPSESTSADWMIYCAECGIPRMETDSQKCWNCGGTDLVNDDG